MRPEGADLNRLAALTGKVFNVPIAYAAMLGQGDRVMSRVGSGNAYWKHLRKLPLGRHLAAPVVLKDVPGRLPEAGEAGELPGDLKFVASAPIDTLCGQHLGLLVIASTDARPEFSSQDLATLVDLAALMADGIEMRMIASQAMESRLQYGEAERRFRSMANEASALIACNRADGTCEFVNDAWLRFTGHRIKDEVGDGWQQAIHERHQEAARDIYCEALRTGKPFTLGIPLRRHDGVFRKMRGHGTPRFLTDSSFAGFLISLTDLSDYTFDPSEVIGRIEVAREAATGSLVLL